MSETQARRTTGQDAARSGKRADARRNIEAIVQAATRLLAVDPDASVNDIARAAGIGRVTVYGHFDSRTTLVREVAERAIRLTDEALAGENFDGDAPEALGRLLEMTWHLTHEFGALVVAATGTLPPEEIRRAHEEPASRVRILLERGRAAGQFSDSVPIEWQVSLIQAILHAASAAVHRGEITAEEAPTLVRTSALAALAG